MAKSDIGRYEDLVYELLKKYPFLRDNVGQLYLSCISIRRGKEYVRGTTLYDFFVTDCNNESLSKVPTMASVIRLNTRLQKENPELRGKDWEAKQKHSKDYKEDLGYGKGK